MGVLHAQKKGVLMRVKYRASVFVPLALIVNLGTASASHCGDAYFNNDVTWWHNSPLYYSVAGAPASTCGDVWVSRNGNPYVKTAGWICTDSNGNATKGPWHWSNQADDETAEAYVDWGSCTSPLRKHIWDIDPPTATVTSSCPSSFSGTAADDDWGAGFDSDWAACEGEFYNSSTGRWWHPSTGTYSATSAIYVTCACSGMPSLNISWSCSSKPDLGDHISGQSYVWRAWVWDGGQWNDPHNDASARCGFTY